MITSEPSESLKQKLQRALKSKAVLTERSKQLQQQVEDFRKREDAMNHIASELLERQRELNFMLHRASSVLHQLQDTNKALSAEFTHIVKELPAPESEKWDETVSRVNDLFKKTHELAGDLQDELLRTTQTEIPKIETSQPAPRPTPEPPAQEQHVPEPKAIHGAEIGEEIPHTAEVVARVAEPATVTAAEQAPPTKPIADTPKPNLSIDELFARVDSMELGDSGDDLVDRRPKRGFFAKLMGRVSEDE